MPSFPPSAARPNTFSSSMAAISCPFPGQASKPRRLLTRLCLDNLPVPASVPSRDSFCLPKPTVVMMRCYWSSFTTPGVSSGLSAAKYPEDTAVQVRMKSYELAFRMQTPIPEVFKLSGETASTSDLYGLNNPVSKPFGETCLLARRLVERGVRFVQLYHGGGGGGSWDAHANLKDNHGKLSPMVDQPIGGLLRDLKQRGLLDETIVVWATEFGRTPGEEGSKGRDHHPYGFSCWLASGGLKGGPRSRSDRRNRLLRRRTPPLRHRYPCHRAHPTRPHPPLARSAGPQAAGD